MKGYSDTPLVAGSLVGRRYFSVDRFGRLISLNLPVPFLPGVNEAVCRRDIYTRGMTIWTGVGAGQEKPEQVILAPGHPVASLECTCGYYAFFDNTERFNGVFGIIEGTGLCTTGTLGFRASRARLLAMVKPKWLTDVQWGRVAHNYPDVPVFGKKKEAMAEYPLTVVDLPTPETDQDFWTRDA